MKLFVCDKQEKEKICKSCFVVCFIISFTLCDCFVYLLLLVVLILVPAIMSSVCCGTKKQKLNNSYSNHVERPINGYPEPVAIPDMCYFCFDVLYCQLHSMDPPQTPLFTNDA